MGEFHRLNTMGGVRRHVLVSYRDLVGTYMLGSEKRPPPRFFTVFTTFLLPCFFGTFFSFFDRGELVGCGLGK